MPTLRESISVSQLAELLGVEPWRLIAVEVNLLKHTAQIVLQPEADRELRTRKGGVYGAHV